MIPGNRHVSQSTQKIKFHIDVNSAYLSWSAIRLLESGSKTDLRRIPSIVGGDQKTRHGIVVAKSIPAKKYGIHTADTVASAFKKCPNLVSVPPDHKYYKEKSNQLMDYLKDICPRIQQVSIDECYMDFEPLRASYPSPEAAARAICDGVLSSFGFTVNIGISDKKVLAKMASDFEKPNKVHTLYSSEIREKLWPLPIQALHMCGKSSAEKLRQIGISTIGNLAVSDRSRINDLLKSHGDLLWRYANGLDDSEIHTKVREAKSIGNSTTLPEDADSREKAVPVLERLAESVAGRLEKHGLTARQVSVEIKYATFQAVSHQMTLDVPTSDKMVIYDAACMLFDQLWDQNPIRLLGIRTARLQKAGAPYQMNLFDYQKQLEDEQEKREAELRLADHKKQLEETERKKQEKKKRLEAAVGKIQKKYGPKAIRKGQ